MLRTALAITVGLLLSGIVLAQESGPTRKQTGISNPEVKREVYVKRPDPKGKTPSNAHYDGGALVKVYYIGPGLQREEEVAFQKISDTPENPKRRRSMDNGRTWSEYEELPPIVTRDHGVLVFWGTSTSFHDPTTNLLVSIWLRQTRVKPYACHCSSRFSKDEGRTWSEPKFLRYEDGADFDPDNPLDLAFLKNNQAYFGNNIIRHSSGKLIHVACSVNVPYENLTGKSYDSRVPKDAKNIGSRCFIGEWEQAAGDYAWTPGAPVWIPLEVSARGLMEPSVVELKDGRLLVVWRGSNTPITPGRKWFSVSDDGGKTLSPVREWKYDDGTRFYSPSSIHRFIRHSVNGKLYWIGNICPKPPKGNWPREPLIIAEVDESIPALKRDTVTVIDKKGPGDSDKLQLSNFHVLENRETHELELYLTRWGGFEGGNAYKYTLTFK